VKILSGDPSRGALALDTEQPLLIGQTVQFMAPSRTRTRSSHTSPPIPNPGTITFSALPRTESVDDPTDGESRVVEGFLGMSEDGFVLDSGICNVPFATASWRLS